MKKTLRVLLIGSAGRMGQTIVDLAKRDPNLEIAAQCDLGDAIEPAMKKSDVAIDFSNDDSADEICRVALQHRQPLVIGTTGHSPDQRRVIEKTAEGLPIVFASNFSIGVNTLFWLTRKTAELLGPEFNLEIIETNQVKKKKAPRGTAKKIAKILKTARTIVKEVPTQSIRE